MLKLYLVRHGETAANQQGVYYGYTDLPLTEQGISQARHVGKALATITFDHVIVSGLQRTQQTAHIILAENQQTQALPVIEPRFNELNFGEWEGRHYQELEQHDSERYSAWCQDWQNSTPPKGESFIQLKQRVEAALTEQILTYNDKTLLIVGHQGVLRVLLLSLLDLPANAFWQFSFHQGAYSIVNFAHQHGCVDVINATAMQVVS